MDAGWQHMDELFICPPATAAGLACHGKWSVRPPATDAGLACHGKWSVRLPATAAGLACHGKWSVCQSGVSRVGPSRRYSPVWDEED